MDSINNFANNGQPPQHMPYHRRETQPNSRQAAQQERALHTNSRRMTIASARSATFRPGANSHRTGTAGPAEQLARPDIYRGRLSEDYKTRKPAFFARWTVFKVLWAEPYGETGNSSAGSRVSTVDSSVDGETIQSKPKIFVVVGSGTEYCSCLAISSHGETGVRNRSFKSEYGIAYMGNDVPLPLDNEDDHREMQRHPIQVTPDPPHVARLSPTSRIHFGRIHNIEYNLKAKSIGFIPRASRAHIVSQFNALSKDPQILLRPDPPRSSITSSLAHGTTSESINALTARLCRGFVPAPQSWVLWTHRDDPSYRQLLDEFAKFSIQRLQMEGLLERLEDPTAETPEDTPTASKGG